MALFINVDPVPARWYWRRVLKGWQFGYSGGTENDFVIDIEVAKWRFVCFIGFKYVMNPSVRQERHEQWRKEEERVRRRANKSESFISKLFRGRWRNQAAGHRMDQKHSVYNHPSSLSRLVLAPKSFLRFVQLALDGDHQRGRQLAARHDLSEPIRGNAAASVQGVVLHPEHQGQTSDYHDPEEAETRRLPQEKNS